MTLPTLISFYSGGGLVEAGLRGLVEPIGAVEYDAAIADVYRANHGDHIRVARVEDLKPSSFDRPDMLWLSPPCQEHSAARNKKLASRADADAALAVLPFLRAWQPPFVFVENVERFRHAHSFKAIIQTLAELGYWYDVQVLNAANYGVPQTRRRLIVRACRDGMVPQLPQPVPWVGWYEAIEDLIPTLPDSTFAAWQLKRLPEQLSRYASLLVHPTEMRSHRVIEQGAPAFTVTCTHGVPRAFLVSNGGQDGDLWRDPHEPSPTVTTQSNGRVKAFLVGGANTSDGQAAPGVGDSDAGEPARCVNASNSQQWRAFIVPGGNASSFDVRFDHEPVRTIGDVQRVGNAPRAFVVDCQESGSQSGLTIRADADPMFTVSASMEPRRPARAWLDHGRVVKMTPRALARFQSVPDWYELPDRASLATTVIGNGVPSLLAREIVATTAGLSVDRRELLEAA